MSAPTVRSAFVMGVRAVAGEGWLVPVGALVSLVRSVAPFPAVAGAAALLGAGARRGLALHPGSVAAAAEGAFAVAVSPRFHALIGGLWLAGTLLAGLLRVLLLAGALPTLGARMAGADATRRFAPGAVRGLPAQLATWLLAGLAQFVAVGYLAAVFVASIRLAAEPPTAGAFLPAALGAVALTVGILGLVATRVVGDAAAARTAILGEGPASALAGATRRFVERPGGFVLGGLAVALAGAAGWMALQPFAGLVASLEHRVGSSVAMGPELMFALVAFLGAATLDLAWLATIAALACASEPARDDSGLSA